MAMPICAEGVLAHVLTALSAGEHRLVNRKNLFILVGPTMKSLAQVKADSLLVSCRTRIERLQNFFSDAL